MSVPPRTMRALIERAIVRLLDSNRKFPPKLVQEENHRLYRYLRKLQAQA